MKRTREAVIDQGTEAAAALTAAVVQITAFDDVTLAIYIQSTKKMLEAAEQEQTRRLSRVFLPPKGPSPRRSPRE